MSDYLYIFIHVGKCAGATINNHIRKNFTEDEVLAVRGRDSVDKAAVAARIEAMSPKEREKIRVIYGQFAYYGIGRHFEREARYFTMLRHPVKRTISHYNYLVTRRPLAPQIFHGVKREDGSIIPFEEWLENYNSATDYMLRVLYQNREGEESDIEANMTEKHLEVVKEHLANFYFLGITENSKTDMPLIFDFLGIEELFENSNLSKPYFVPKEFEKTKELIMGKTRLDHKLYEFAREINLITAAKVRESLK